MAGGGTSGRGAVLHNSETVRSLAAHQSLLTLLHEGAPDIRALARLAVPMTETNFLSMCEERSLANRCGNPLCAQRHQHKSAADSARIDWKSLAILKVSVDQHWCSYECHIKCAQFAKSLGNAMDRLEVLRKLKAGPSLVSHHGSTNEHDENDAMIKGILGGVKESSAARTARQPTPSTSVAAIDGTEGMGLGVGAVGTAAAADDGHNPQAPGTAGPGPCDDVPGHMELPQVAHGPCSDTAHVASPLCSSAAAGLTRHVRRSRTSELMKDLQRSLKQPIAPTDSQDFDYHDHGKPDTADATEDAASEQQGEAPQTPGAPYVSGVSGYTAVPSTDDGSCSNMHAHANLPLSQPFTMPMLPCDGPNSVPLAMTAADADGRGSDRRGSYENVKGKFKPRSAEVCSNTVRHVQDQQTCKLAPEKKVDAACTTAASHRESSSAAASSSQCPGTSPSSHDSTGGKATPGPRSDHKKKVAFGSCQMYEYDPELPPADSGEDDCVCEVPLLPEAEASPLQGLQNSFMSAPEAAGAHGMGRVWNAGGSMDDAACGHDAHTRLLARGAVVEGISGVIERSGPGSNSPVSPEIDNTQLGAISEDPVALQGPGSRAVAADAGGCDEVTPVLFFDVHAQQSEGEMEGALRVTTAEALQLSDQDIAELRSQMEAGTSADAAAVLDVQADDVGSSDDNLEGEAAVEEPQGAGDERPGERIRRPRLRKARQGAAAVEVSQDSLSAEQQHHLNQQAVADAFRYYLAPEAGGVGIAASGSALHELASDLAKRKRVAAETHDPGASQAKPNNNSGNAAAEQAPCTARPADVVNPPDLEDDSSVESWSPDSDDSDGSDVHEGDLGQDDQGDGAEDDDAPGDGQSAEGYFDAAATAKPVLSVFGVAWRLLGIWVCQASVLHLHKPDVHCTHCFSEPTRQGQRALTSVLLKRVAPLLESLAMPRTIPVALAEGQVHDLLATLDVRLAVPTLEPAIQDCLVLVLLAAIARHRMPQMAEALDPSALHMKAVLERIDLAPALFTCLLDCLVDTT